MSDLKFNTVEEMVAWVVAHPTYDNRFNISINISEEFDDLEAGEKWDNEPLPDYGTPEHKVYFARKPSTHIVKTYTLREPNHISTFKLDTKLGEKVYEAWPKKSNRYSTKKEPYGARTLAGVLKLLGQDDITEKVKEAKARDKAELEKRRRNSYRRAIVDKIAALQGAITEANNVCKLNFPQYTFPELLPLLEEES